MSDHEVVVQFSTDNAAFDQDAAYHEIARIFRSIANRVELRTLEGKIYDVNGNAIGEWRATLPEA